MYNEQDLVRIAKRENNTKRTYLVANQFQGKYLAVKPFQALEMFRALADIVKDRYSNEKLLLIGFAEAATAVGAAVAIALKTAYIQTTREQISDVEYLYFLEEHSHAKEQKLVKNDMDSIIGEIDRILFIEDELTTGNTILNIVNLIQKQYSNKIQFSVASLLNGMEDTALTTFRDRNIDLFWLAKINLAPYAAKAASYKTDGTIVLADSERIPSQVQYIKINKMPDTRRLVDAVSYADSCEKLYQDIAGQVDLKGMDRILVLGTEEFMYPALFVAERIEAQGKTVQFHATARMPVVVSREKCYPFHIRYELISLYDNSRTTYLYDLGQYDKVIVITDAKVDMAKGTATLLNALSLAGNENIVLVSQ